MGFLNQRYEGSVRQVSGDSHAWREWVKGVGEQDTGAGT
jgi:hypothetical protein